MSPTIWQVFFSFLQLGCTSFGGPIAHIGYFRHEFVERKRWLSAEDYNDLVALCQFLPGPASSQVGMAIGLLRVGYLGAFVAWLGFTLPSALMMLALAAGLQLFAQAPPAPIIHGLKLVALAVIAQAVYAMATTLCNSKTKLSIMLMSLLLLNASSVSYWQLVVMAFGAILGMLWLKGASQATTESLISISLSKRAGFAWGLVFILLLIALPLLTHASNHPLLSMIDAFFRAGSLVFGGGHAVLPLLQAEFVTTGAMNADTFIAGYGAVQAVPGPLFSFAGFLGAAMQPPETGMTGLFIGGCIALMAIFAPAFLFIAAVLPFWQSMRSNRWLKAALAGTGASVVGILVSTLYNPVWTSTIFTPLDLLLACCALIALQVGKISSWLLVLSAVSVAVAIDLCF